MAVYSIKDLEKLSGVKAHTIRIWEKRYGILNPRRTKTNIRFYQDQDLKYLMNIALLKRNGFKISEIAEMSREEVSDQVSVVGLSGENSAGQVDAMSLSLLELDEFQFDKIIDTNADQLGFERTMLEVIYPFLDRLSLMWLTGSIKPVQENFIYNLIRQKLIAAIDRIQKGPDPKAKRFILYMPQGEKQDLSLLFLHYVIKNRGFKIVNLGANTSMEDLITAVEIFKADYVFTMITETFAEQPVQQYVDALKKHFPKQTILLSGYQVVAQHIENQENVRILQDFQETRQYLEVLSKQSSMNGQSINGKSSKPA